MKKQNKSLALTLILTKLMFAGLVFAAAAAPWFIREYDEAKVLPLGLPSIYPPLLVTFYLAFAAALPAIWVLHKLLKNIAEARVFIAQNVGILRLISYLCFAEGIIFFGFGFFRPLSFIVALAAIFFGLVMRVLRNVFAAAVEIKEENDFTI